MSTGPLAGLRVLDLTRLLPGGYATCLLADLGADVVKVEEPGRGDYIRLMPPMVRDVSANHVALNRNKRSVTLNLKAAEGREVFEELVPAFDVVVESFRPGVMDRLGIGWARLSALHPGLVYCAITGYGQDGPRAGVAGHDIDYAAYAGILGITGEEGGPPVVPGVQIGDLAGGGMTAVIAILAALRKRDATGEGDFCDVAMTDGLVSWLSIHAAAYFATGEVPRRGAMHLSGAYPCYRVYPVADGWLAVGALEPQFWTALCDAIDRADLAGDGFATGARRDEVVAELEALFSARTRAEWMEHFRDADVCVAPVNDFAETFADAQVIHRGMVVEAPLADGTSWRHVGTPVKLSGAPADVARRPPPGLGEHTDEVLSAAGVDDGRIARLRAAGVV
ncbi:MAG TPA: CaiB/BaiF CoA-transferase family protein [Actinomycetota bacterium]|nr:CaiB/BaiF CoA-transferase family protein [Actinomycetota bacterium]